MAERLNTVDVGPGNGTVDWLIEQYRAGHKYAALKPNSVRDYDIHLAHISRTFGKFQAREITPVAVQTFYDRLVSENGPVTAKKVRSMFRAIYGHGIPRGFVETDPSAHVQMVSHKSDGSPPWPQWAFNAVDRYGRWELRTFVALALYTGQRTSDVLRMGPADIRGNQIRVVQDKTGKELWIPIHQNLAPAIIEARAKGKATFLFGRTGKAMSPDDFRAMFDRERDRHRIIGPVPFSRFRPEKITPHGLRKSGVVKLLEAGVDEQDVASVTGQSLEMVRHYGKGWDQTQRANRAIRQWEAHG